MNKVESDSDVEIIAALEESLEFPCEVKWGAAPRECGKRAVGFLVCRVCGPRVPISEECWERKVLVQQTLRPGAHFGCLTCHTPDDGHLFYVEPFGSAS